VTAPDDEEPDLNDFFAINLNPELALAIGCLAVQWSRLETNLHLLCVGMLQGRGQNAYILTASLGNRSISDFLNSCADAASEKESSLAADLRVLTSEFNRLLGIRNRIVHGNWHETEDSANLVTFVARFKGRVNILDEVWNIAQIELTIDQCLDLTQCVTALMVHYHLDIPLRRWMRESSKQTPAARQNANLPGRDPKMTKLVLRLLA
jgi:hypothetical protein